MTPQDVVGALKDAGASPLVIAIVVIAFVLITSSPLRGKLGVFYRFLFSRAEQKAAAAELTRLRERDQEQAEREDALRERDHYRGEYEKLWERLEPRDTYIAYESNWHTDLAANQPELHRQLPPHQPWGVFLAEWTKTRAALRAYHLGGDE